MQLPGDTGNHDEGGAMPIANIEGMVRQAVARYTIADTNRSITT